MRITKRTSIVFASVLWLAACSSAPPVSMAPPPPTPVAVKAPAAAASAARPAPTTASSVKPVVLPPYLDPASALSKNRSAYFDYDVFAIKPEFIQMLELHGKYLASNPKLAIRVEGNADERGGVEYNLALGQKRADAVVRALKLYGVKDSQVEAISWGKEKPKSAGHDESAWAQNRRADLVYPSK